VIFGNISAECMHQRFRVDSPFGDKMGKIPKCQRQIFAILQIYRISNSCTKYDWDDALQTKMLHEVVKTRR